jgi:hypothetical protein
MPFGLPVALVILAQAASAASTPPAAISPQVYGPAAPAPAKPAPIPASAKAAERECAPQASDSKANEIVVCAVKPQGYRLDPDVLEARKLKKQGDTVRPRNPHETYSDHNCATIGPMGCRGVPTINVIAVAATAAKIADRLSKGQEIGSIFETEPHPSEYQLYVEAKRLREAREDEVAARAKATTERAEKPSSAPGSTPQKESSATASPSGQNH